MPTKRLYTIHCRGGRRMPFLGFVCLIGIINELDNLILCNHIPISNSKAPHLSNSTGQAEIIQNYTKITNSVLCWGLYASKLPRKSEHNYHN